MAPIRNPLSWPWRIGLTLLSVAAAAGVGAFYGAVAIYEANYISHIIVAILAAFLLYWIMRVPRDSYPGFCFFVAALASVCMLVAGWWVTYDFIRSGFPAHTKSTPIENYETALDVIVERNNEAANPFNWEPQGTSVRVLNPAQLARDLWDNYSVFFRPVLVVLAVAMLLPESEPKPVIVFWASLFTLQAAAALLTGTQQRFVSS